MRRLSTKAKEPAHLWIERIKDFKRLWDSDNRLTERRRYQRAVTMNDFGRLVPWRDEVLLGGDIPDQVVMNLLERYERRVKAMAFDESPEIRFSRDRKGSEKIADGINRLMSRVSERAGLPMAFRRGVTLLCTDGAFALYRGVEQVFTRGDAEAVGKSMEEVYDDASAGNDQPSPAQDNAQMAQVLVTKAANPADLIANPPTVTAAVIDSAEARAQMAVKEQKQANPNLDKGRVYEQLLVYGLDFARDPTVLESNESRWMARLIRMPEEEVRNSTLLDAEARKKIPVVHASSRDTKADPVPSGESSEDYKRAELWEVFDLWYGTRHIVCENFEFYCEASDEYPYQENGKPGLRKFFPFTLCEPHVGTGDKPKDRLPIPLFRSGWHKQIEFIKIDSHICQAIKRACVDKYAAVAALAAHTDLLTALTDGRPGTCVMLPPEIQDIRAAFQSLTFNPPLAEAIAERGRILYDFSVCMNFPVAELTSQPVADTVGQEEIAMASGNATTTDILRVLQVAYGEAVADEWRLVQLTYPEELLAEEAGDQYIEAVLGVPTSMLDDESLRKARTAFAQMVKFSPLKDETPRVRFGVTSKDENPVRVKQTIEFATWIWTTFGPASLPAVLALAQEASRALGNGDLPLGDITPEAMAMQAMSQAGGPPGTETGNGPPGSGPGAPADGGSGTNDRESVRKGARQIAPA